MLTKIMPMRPLDQAKSMFYKPQKTQNTYSVLKFLKFLPLPLPEDECLASA